VKALGLLTATPSDTVYLLEGVIPPLLPSPPASFPGENLDHVGRMTRALMASLPPLEVSSWKLCWMSWPGRCWYVASLFLICSIKISSTPPAPPFSSSTLIFLRKLRADVCVWEIVVLQLQKYENLVEIVYFAHGGWMKGWFVFFCYCNTLQ
jgi:hypothetical protein